MESDWPKRNKSHYITEIVSWLGFTDVIFWQQPEIRLRLQARILPVLGPKDNVAFSFFFEHGVFF